MINLSVNLVLTRVQEAGLFGDQWEGVISPALVVEKV